MSLRSGIYIGHVRHRRREPRHEFTFPLFMAYLDLSELDRVLSLTRLWGRSRWCPARFRREDYLTRAGLGLEESVRTCVHDQLGRRPTGPIRMLTHLRYFGHTFNPVTFYYCFDEQDRPDAIVAEITNTPWRERHAYTLDARGSAPGRALAFRFGKQFHISPLLPMDLDYEWIFTEPGSSLLVHMNLLQQGAARERRFDATLRMERREITPHLLRSLLLRYPLMTVQVLASIHWHALRLWLKGAKVHTHPKHAATPHPEQSP